MNYEKVQMTEFEQSVYDLCPVLGIEEAKATASDILELAKKTLLKTGKVVLASNYPEGCSFEDGFHLGYNEGFDTCKEQMMKETVEGEVKDFRFIHEINYSSAQIEFDSIPKLKDGDKVHIITIKEN